MTQKLVEIECRKMNETEKALYLSTTGDFGSGEWVPKSVVEWHPDSHEDTTGTAVMPESWAVSKGFI